METLEVLPTQLQLIAKASLHQALTEAVSCEEDRDIIMFEDLKN